MHSLTLHSAPLASLDDNALTVLLRKIVHTAAL